MRTLYKFLIGGAAIGLAAPLAAQYNPYPTQPGYNYPVYPGQSYPQQQYPQQQYPQGYPGNTYQQGYGNPVGQIIDQLLGNRYNVTDRQAVTRCANAAISQAANQYAAQYGGQYAGQYRYNRFRVTSINDVQRRSNGLRVTGMLDSGNRYGNQRDDRYRNSAFNFRCNVDYRGAVTNVRVRPSDYRRN